MVEVGKVKKNLPPKFTDTLKMTCKPQFSRTLLQTPANFKRETEQTFPDLPADLCDITL
jgi:hypothetical protein